MTRHFNYRPSASKGDNLSERSSAPVVSMAVSWWVVALFPSGKQEYNCEAWVLAQTSLAVTWTDTHLFCYQLDETAVVIHLGQVQDVNTQQYCKGPHAVYHTSDTASLILTLKVLNFWKLTSYCSLKPLWSGMGEVVLARTSPTLHPTSPLTVHQLSWLAL